jgi:apolipoprotein D and lipocalin family protein
VYKPSGRSAVLASLVPLVRRRFAARDEAVAADDPTPVDNVDLERYSGNWLQSARLGPSPRHDGEGLTSLTFHSNGQVLEVERRSLRAGRRAHVASGVVRVVPDSGGARLKLSFAPAWLRWLPNVWEDHWVLHLEPDYSAALVGNPQRTQLALMVRRFKGCEGAVERMLVVAREQGYPIDELEFVSSAKLRSSPVPAPPPANPTRQPEPAQRS